MKCLPPYSEGKPIKGYCAWIGADRKLRIRKAAIDSEGNATVKNGPKAVRVDVHRTFGWKRKTAFMVVGSSAQCIDVFGLRSDSIITATEYAEAVGNNYAEQAMSELGKTPYQTVRDWLVIGCIALVLVLTIYSFNETKDALHELGRIMLERFPAAAPQPTPGRGG